MQASGGKIRLATFDGELLQDNAVIPDNSKYFKFVFMKQISQLPNGVASSLSDICSRPSSLGDLTQEEAHIMNALAVGAMHGQDTDMTVDVSGSEMVVNLLFAKDDNSLGILYQHADICLWCNQLATQL